MSFVGCFSALSSELQAKSKKIPHIMYTRKPCCLGVHPETFQIIPNCKEVNKALSNIVSKLSWLDVFIIHDKTLGNLNIYISLSLKDRRKIPEGQGNSSIDNAMVKIEKRQTDNSWYTKHNIKLKT